VIRHRASRCGRVVAGLDSQSITLSIVSFFEMDWRQKKHISAASAKHRFLRDVAET
jgi:PIN domain nuclease of toxin-antitoxin system